MLPRGSMSSPSICVVGAALLGLTVAASCDTGTADQAASSGTSAGGVGGAATSGTVTGGAGTGGAGTGGSRPDPLDAGLEEIRGDAVLHPGEAGATVDAGPAETTRCVPRFPYQDEPDLGAGSAATRCILCLSSRPRSGPFGTRSSPVTTSDARRGMVAAPSPSPSVAAGSIRFITSGRCTATGRRILGDHGTAGDRFWSRQPWLTQACSSRR